MKFARVDPSDRSNYEAVAREMRALPCLVRPPCKGGRGWTAKASTASLRLWGRLLEDNWTGYEVAVYHPKELR